MREGTEVRTYPALSIIAGATLVAQVAIAQTARPPSGPDVDRDPVAAALGYAQRTGAVRLIVRVNRAALPAGVAAPMAANEFATRTVKPEDLVQEQQLTADLVTVTVRPSGIQDLLRNNAVERVYIDTLSRSLLQ